MSARGFVDITNRSEAYDVRPDNLGRCSFRKGKVKKDKMVKFAPLYTVSFLTCGMAVRLVAQHFLARDMAKSHLP